jgi:phosphoglycerate dehydrogenase-like enzyme
MGMTVHAYTATPRLTPESRRDDGYTIPSTGDPDGVLPTSWHYGSDKASLHAFLSLDLDHLVVCLPLTSQTLKLLGAKEFSVLSSHCTRRGRKPFLTNISRGKILDQDAIVASLHSGELSGAALDVTDPEPLPADHPLWSAPNVQITPHMSGAGVEYFSRCLDVLRVNLERMQKGQELVNSYPRKRGY